MANPTVYWLVEASKVLGRAIPFFGTVAGLVTLIYDLGETMLVSGLNFLIAHISSIDTSLFSNASFGAVASIGYANAVFPLSEFVAIWTAVITAKLTIIIIRWVKSVIPTVSN